MVACSSRCCLASCIAALAVLPVIPMLRDEASTCSLRPFAPWLSSGSSAWDWRPNSFWARVALSTPAGSALKLSAIMPSCVRLSCTLRLAASRPSALNAFADVFEPPAAELMFFARVMNPWLSCLDWMPRSLAIPTHPEAWAVSMPVIRDRPAVAFARLTVSLTALLMNW